MEAPQSVAARPHGVAGFAGASPSPGCFESDQIRCSNIGFRTRIYEVRSTPAVLIGHPWRHASFVRYRVRMRCWPALRFGHHRVLPCPPTGAHLEHEVPSIADRGGNLHRWRKPVLWSSMATAAEAGFGPWPHAVPCVPDVGSLVKLEPDQVQPLTMVATSCENLQFGEISTKRG